MSKYIPNSHQTPNVLVDEIMHLLNESELKCYLFAIRHIYGWQDKIERGYAHISLSMFENGFSTFSGTGLSRSSINKALKELTNYRLLLKLDMSTRDGQAYAIGENPDVDGLIARSDKKKSRQKSTSAKSTLVQNNYQQQYENTTATSAKSAPKQTQDKTQEQNLPTAEADGQPSKTKKRNNPFSDAVIAGIAEPVFGSTPDAIASGRNHVVYSCVNGIRDAYKSTIGIPESMDVVSNDIQAFLTWYRRKYQNVPYARQRDKINLHYMDFLNSQKSTTILTDDEKRQYDLSVQAQIELGYDTITPNLMNDEIKKHVETMTPWT